VIVGGLGTLVGPIVGCVAIQWLTSQIGTQQVINSNLVLGAILVIFVLLVPKGIVPGCGSVGAAMAARMRRRPVVADQHKLHKPSNEIEANTLAIDSHRETSQ
jgi:hypothetical protein